MGEKKKNNKKKIDKKGDQNKKDSVLKIVDSNKVEKEIPKYDTRPHFDPRMIGAIPSLSVQYQEIIQPIVDHHKYGIITKTAPINPNCLVAKPTILVIGPQNSGKTSLINYFLNDEEGYIKKCEGLKTNLQNFTHIIYGLSNAYTSPSTAISNVMWQFNNLKDLTKEDNEGQLQLVTLNHPLLNEINFIDCPGITKNFGESSKDEPGFMCLLKNLFDRVDLIFFIGTPHTLKGPIEKVLDEINRVSFKTIFLLNKSDEQKNENELIKTKETYKHFLSNIIKDTDLPIFQVCLDGKKHDDKNVQDLIQADMDLMTERVSKLPTSYKVSRITTIMKHTMSVLLISFLQNELYKRAKRQFAHIIIKPKELSVFANEFFQINGAEKFVDNNKDHIIKSYSTLERSKWNPYKPEKIADAKRFLQIDLPYLINCANEEPEVVVKYSLPGISKKDDENNIKSSISALSKRKKIIKEIKIDIPQEDEDEEEDGEEEENKEEDNKDDQNKEEKKKKKKPKQIKLNQAVLDQLNK